MKVTSRCNINCDYCYEYHHGDDSWKFQSKLMEYATFERTIQQIAAHAHRHAINHIYLSLHGGEPLLLGPGRLAEFSGLARSLLQSKGVTATISLQTNGTLITDEIAKIIHERQIFVGISIDGSQAHNDLHRIDFRGRSTYHATLKGIETLKNHAPDFIGGILSVIDLRNDPIETFDAIAKLGIPNIDFLLPHHNWNNPPPRSEAAIEPEYARWYLAVWRHWTRGPHSNVRVRFLDNLVARLTGHPGLYEQMSLSPPALVTINPNGDYEGVDTLKSSGAQAQKTGLNIWSNTFDDFLATTAYTSRQKWPDMLPTPCHSCDLSRICVGGYLPHRYSRTMGLDNRSVYCEDLYMLIRSIRDDIKKTLENEQQ